MPANLFAEEFGLRPRAAFGMSVGGAAASLAIAASAAWAWLWSGRARHVLVVAGENCADGMAREASTAILAQVGHPTYDVPLGGRCQLTTHGCPHVTCTSTAWTRATWHCSPC